MLEASNKDSRITLDRNDMQSYVHMLANVLYVSLRCVADHMAHQCYNRFFFYV